MTYRHRLQASRFELKYVVSDHVAGQIRQFLRSHLELDDHAPKDGNFDYRVQSIYNDSNVLFLCRQTIEGAKNRYKLRMRFYDDKPDSPVFLEIKRRVTDVIKKQRAMVTRDGAHRLLTEGWIDRNDLVDPGNEKQAEALHNFLMFSRELNAEGMIYVCYMREAYVSPDSDQVRVTFDRDLFGTVYHKGDDIRVQTQGVRPEIGGVILELKFTDRFPSWMRDLVQAFNLQRRSVPKYVDCIEAMGLMRRVASGAGTGIVR